MRFSFMKRGPQPKRLFNAAQCRARSKLALSIAKVVSDPKLRARLKNQAAKMEQRASLLEAKGIPEVTGPIPV
jgi:hypothetical protein